MGGIYTKGGGEGFLTGVGLARGGADEEGYETEEVAHGETCARLYEERGAWCGAVVVVLACASEVFRALHKKSAIG